MRDLRELEIGAHRRAPRRPAPTPAAIRAFEAEFGRRLPADFLAFLAFANGGCPTLDMFVPEGATPADFFDVDRFLPLDADEPDVRTVRRALDDVRAILGRDLLPFAESLTGNPYVLNFASNPPTVAMSSRLNDFALLPVAPSFAAFIDGLCRHPAHDAAPNPRIPDTTDHVAMVMWGLNRISTPDPFPWPEHGLAGWPRERPAVAWSPAPLSLPPDPPPEKLSDLAKLGVVAGRRIMLTRPHAGLPVGRVLTVAGVDAGGVRLAGAERPVVPVPEAVLAAAASCLLVAPFATPDGRPFPDMHTLHDALQAAGLDGLSYVVAKVEDEAGALAGVVGVLPPADRDVPARRVPWPTLPLDAPIIPGIADAGRIGMFSLATQRMIGQLWEAPWFTKVGVVEDDRADFVGSWGEALRHATARDWQYPTIEQVARIREDLRISVPARYALWDVVAEDMGGITQALIEDKVAPVAAAQGLPEIFGTLVTWDILHALIESEYRDVRAPHTFFNRAYWYIIGHFPCGWRGPVEEGRPIVF